MLLLYYIILPISEPSIIFSMSHDCVICDICDHPITDIMYDIILYSLSKYKIKIKIKKKENK